MFTASGSPAAVSSLPAWHILFARETEPDLELDEPVADDTDETDAGDDGGGDPHGSGDDQRQKMIKLALLAVVAAAGLYVAMDPSVLMGPSEEPPPVPAPAAPKAAPAAQPKPAAPPPAGASPTPMAPQPVAQAPSPAPATVPPPTAQPPAARAMPTAPAVPTQPQPKNPMSTVATAPASTMPGAMPAAPPKPAAVSTGLSPLFSEGQLVVVLPDPTKPAGPIALMADAGSSRPGPTVGPNASATVLDGELRNNGWLYAIRTAQGATGWISEKHLQAK